MSGKAGRALSVYEPERFPVSARQTVIKMISLWATAFPVGGHCRAAFQSAHGKEYGYLRVSRAVAPSVVIGLTPGDDQSRAVVIRPMTLSPWRIEPYDIMPSKLFAQVQMPDATFLAI